MIPKRYQVFVSSTYEDLREERQHVIQALLELDCIPAGMELFPAADDDQWTLIKNFIDECDYYIVIIGGRYGSIGPKGISYTEMEYRYAIEKKKPIVAFVCKDRSALPVRKTDPSRTAKRKLDNFIALAQRKMCGFWATPADLDGLVSWSIVKLMKTKPGIGWIRADKLPDDDVLERLGRLGTENAELRAELKKTRDQADRVAREQIVVSKGLSSQGQGEMVARKRLPATRPSITHKFDLAHNEGYLNVGLFEDGTPGELFIRMSKEGSMIGGMMDAFATAISLCLQHGVPLESLVKKFTHQRFEPSGLTSNRDIPFAKSIVDYVFRWLGLTFLEDYRKAHFSRRSSASTKFGSRQRRVRIVAKGA